MTTEQEGVKQSLEIEMAPPRPPGVYELGTEGPILVVTLRDPKLGNYGGWTETLYSRAAWNKQTKTHRQLLNGQTNIPCHRL